MDRFPDFALEAGIIFNHGTAEVHLTGELDVFSAGQLTDVMREVWGGEVFGREVIDVVIDLTHLTFIDMKGIDALLEVSRVTKQLGLTIQIRHDSPAIHRLAQLLQVTEDDLLAGAFGG